MNDSTLHPTVSHADRDITRLLVDWHAGDTAAADLLAELIYHKLHQLAVAQMNRESRQLTIQPTALVHEVMAQLLEKPPDCVDRSHLYALAARMMRNFLVNQAKGRLRDKRGGAAVHVELDDNLVGSGDPDFEFLAVNQAMESLGRFDARKLDILEHFYFGGLSYPEIARMHKLSRATVHRELRLARAWIASQLQPPSQPQCG